MQQSQLQSLPARIGTPVAIAFYGLLADRTPPGAAVWSQPACLAAVVTRAACLPHRVHPAMQGAGQAWFDFRSGPAQAFPGELVQFLSCYLSAPCGTDGPGIKSDANVAVMRH